MKFLLLALLLVALFLLSAGCINSTQTASDVCVPVKIDAKYPSPALNEMTKDTGFADVRGVVIIDNKSYLITRHSMYDKIIVNKTNRVAIGASGFPRYSYIYEVCE